MRLRAMRLEGALEFCRTRSDLRPSVRATASLFIFWKNLIVLAPAGIGVLGEYILRWREAREA